MELMKRVALCAGLLLFSMTTMVHAATKVAFVTAEGGLGDHSFNDMINDGLKKAKEELGIEYVLFSRARCRISSPR